MRMWIGIVFWVAATGYAWGTPPKKTPPPDIFLITIDTLRADHVHCYGYDQVQTPGLDGLAEDGIRFRYAFTPSPVTNTSHTTIMTGLLPSSHGVVDFAVPLALTHATMAELLKERGYKTAGFIGATILDSNGLAPGLDQGFDFYDNFPAPAETISRWGRVERRGMDVVQRAEAWLNANTTGPHFVWIHLYDPHDPYEPPPPYSRIYKDNLYDGEIAYADSALDDFIKYLKKRGWYNESFVIAVGDHGEGLGQHNEDTHGIFLYDSTTHIPLILKLPQDTDRGRVVEAQVRTTDILPTVLDLIHSPAPERLDGESLRPYFSVEGAIGRTAVGETNYPLNFGWAPLRSVRADGFKFVEAPRPELYNLDADPGELQNIYQPQQVIVQKFRELLKSVPATASPMESHGHHTIDQTKALSYVSGAGVTGATRALNNSPLPDPKDEIEQQNLLHKAVLAVDDGRTQEASGFLEQVLQLDPGSLIALKQLGEIELKAGEYEKAAAHLKLAHEAHPEDVTAAFDEGQALDKTGDLAGARDALETSLRLDPEQFSAQLLLGHIYLDLKNPKAAEDQFEAALLLQPRSVDAQLGLAEAQIAEGSFTEANQELEQLVRAQPNNAKALRLLSQAYSGMGKTEDAARVLKRAGSVKQDP
jgi:choline-sulfatase